MWWHHIHLESVVTWSIFVAARTSSYRRARENEAHIAVALLCVWCRCLRPISGISYYLGIFKACLIRSDAVFRPRWPRRRRAIVPSRPQNDSEHAECGGVPVKHRTTPISSFHICFQVLAIYMHDFFYLAGIRAEFSIANNSDAVALI